MVLKALIPCALLLVAGCGGHPTSGDTAADFPFEGRASPEEMREWEVRFKTQRDVETVARAAYYFKIDHPDRCPGATLDEILRRDPDSDSEFVREAARPAAVDPWGTRIRVEFEGPYKIVLATSAGPDGRFETDDDLHYSTRRWQ